MISAVTEKLICVFVFTYAGVWLSHDAAQIKIKMFRNCFYLSCDANFLVIWLRLLHVLLALQN